MVFWRRKKKTPQELMAAGDYSAAIKGFLELLKGKDDPAMMMQLATAYQRQGKDNDAKKWFVRVGTYYGDQGFFNKSVAAFKKALNITPGDQGILDKLASYNDKVPKFMIDEKFLSKMRQEATRATTAENPKLSEEDLAMAEAAENVEALDMSQSFHMDADHTFSGGASGVVMPEPGQEPVADTSAEPPEVDTLPPDESVIAAGPADVDTIDPNDTLPPNQQPAGDVTPVDKVNPEHTARIDREEVMARALEHTVDGDEEIMDLSELAGDDDFDMNFGEAAASTKAPDPPSAPKTPSKPAPQPKAPESASQPKAPEKPADPASEGQFDQPISRGGMVFRKQETGKKPVTQSVKDTGVFSSFDDALDNIFGGGGDASGGDLFGLDDSIEIAEAQQKAAAAEESFELTLADSSPEENAKHWPLFRTMPQDAFMALILALQTHDYEPGDVIVTEGDAGDEMYLLSEGRVEIVVTIGGQPTVVAHLGEGDFFGEASLLSGAPRNATVRTLEPTNCLLLSRNEFSKLTKDHPSVMASVESIYYTRLKENASRRDEAGS